MRGHATGEVAAPVLGAVKLRIDFDDANQKIELWKDLRRRRGLQLLQIKPLRATRSTRANAYYWTAVVQPFFHFLSEQEPGITSPEQAHEELKRHVLGTRRLRVGRAIIEVVPRTRDMDSATFADYVDRARFWLREMVGIETFDPC
jgi:hypothetical protein